MKEQATKIANELIELHYWADFDLCHTGCTVDEITKAKKEWEIDLKVQEGLYYDSAKSSALVTAKEILKQHNKWTDEWNLYTEVIKILRK